MRFRSRTRVSAEGEGIQNVFVLVVPLRLSLANLYCDEFSGHWTTQIGNRTGVASSAVRIQNPQPTPQHHDLGRRKPCFTLRPIASVENVILVNMPSVAGERDLQK